MPEEPTLEATLTAKDRCDLCGSQAYVYAVMSSGGLLFCNHHWNEFHEKIEETAVRIVDETFRLYE